MGSITGTGLSAASAIGGVGQGAAGGISQAIQQQGAAQAATKLGQSQGFRSGLGTLAGGALGAGLGGSGALGSGIGATTGALIGAFG